MSQIFTLLTHSMLQSKYVAWNTDFYNTSSNTLLATEGRLRSSDFRLSHVYITQYFSRLHLDTLLPLDASIAVLRAGLYY